MAVTIDGSGPITGLTSIASPTTLNGLTIPTTGFGKILQVVRATDTTLRSTTSTSFVDVTGMSITITPQKSDSAVLIVGAFTAQINTTSSTSAFARFRIADSSNNSVSGANDTYHGTTAYNITGGADLLTSMTLLAYATPATLSATTYKLRFLAQGATQIAYVRGDLNTSQMYAIEVSA